MAKIVIACNHDYTTSTGGCEIITKQIAENMVRMGHKCVIFSRAKWTPTTENGVGIVNCGSNPNHFLKNLHNENADYLLVYSDYFCFWPIILAKSQEIKCKKILFPVGLNYTLSNPVMVQMLKSRASQFKIVTHSEDYDDYLFLSKNNIPVSVIPNGVDLKEIHQQNFSFRQKYNIGDKKMFLCVSNFYPGKGQEFLPPILSELHKKYQDFIVVFISSTTEHMVLNRIRDRFSKGLSKCMFKSKMLIDIPREDVIQSLFEADTFLFPSQKEVAPLVLLEAMATGLPWISLDVGNVKSLKGGMIINTPKDKNGNSVYTQQTNDYFIKSIETILLDKENGNYLGETGREKIKKELNWEVISKQYSDLFK